MAHDPIYMISSFLRWRPSPLVSAALAIVFVLLLAILAFIGVLKVHGFHIHSNFDALF